MNHRDLITAISAEFDLSFGETDDIFERTRIIFAKDFEIDYDDTLAAMIELFKEDEEVVYDLFSDQFSIMKRGD